MYDMHMDVVVLLLGYLLTFPEFLGKSFEIVEISFFLQKSYNTAQNVHCFARGTVM